MGFTIYLVWCKNWELNSEQTSNKPQSIKKSKAYALLGMLINQLSIPESLQDLETLGRQAFDPQRKN
jgi:hypothetical protein